MFRRVAGVIANSDSVVDRLGFHHLLFLKDARELVDGLLDAADVAPADLFPVHLCLQAVVLLLEGLDLGLELSSPSDRVDEFRNDATKLSNRPFDGLLLRILLGLVSTSGCLMFRLLIS